MWILLVTQMFPVAVLIVPMYKILVGPRPASTATSA